MDMLRYNRYIADAGWAQDYGTAAEPEEMMGHLLESFPLDNSEWGIEYPTTMVSVADRDVREGPTLPSDLLRSCSRLIGANHYYSNLNQCREECPNTFN